MCMDNFVSLRQLVLKMILFLVVVFALTSVTIAQDDNQQQYLQESSFHDDETMSEICLGCVCEATSNCTMNFGCSRGRCGPFFISSTYWVEAGRPVLFGDNPFRIGAFHACVMDPYCASATVRRYTNKYAQDCDGDGVLTCLDFGRIHYLGGRQCGLSMTRYKYFQVFQECLQSSNSLNG